MVKKVSIPSGMRCTRCRSTHIVGNGTKPMWKNGNKRRVQMYRCYECGKNIQGGTVSDRRGR
jgi:transposase-like protein